MGGLFLLIVFCSSLSAVAQSSSGAKFEVASIHVHQPDQPGKIGFYSKAGGRVELGMCNLPLLVRFALNIDDQLIFGTPDWAKKIRYDIDAVPPDDTASRKLNLDGYTATPTSEQREMILSLLIERFGLKYHVEERDMPVYLLERGKGPLKLEPPKHPERLADPRGGLILRGELATGEGLGQGVTMSFLAQQLMWPLERPVIDRTGVNGTYDFKVDPIEPDNHDRVRGALLMTEALGLKLTSAHAAVRIVQIDSANTPTDN